MLMAGLEVVRSALGSEDSNEDSNRIRKMMRSNRCCCFLPMLEVIESTQRTRLLMCAVKVESRESLNFQPQQTSRDVLSGSGHSTSVNEHSSLMPPDTV